MQDPFGSAEAKPLSGMWKRPGYCDILRSPGDVQFFPGRCGARGRSDRLAWGIESLIPLTPVPPVIMTASCLAGDAAARARRPRSEMTYYLVLRIRSGVGMYVCASRSTAIHPSIHRYIHPYPHAGIHACALLSRRRLKARGTVRRYFQQLGPGFQGFSSW